MEVESMIYRHKPLEPLGYDWSSKASSFKYSYTQYNLQCLLMMTPGPRRLEHPKTFDHTRAYRV